MKYLSIFLILGILLIVSVYFIEQNNKVENIDTDKKTIYVNSLIGCIPLNDKYTPEEWNAKMQLYSELKRGIPRICKVE